MGPTPSFSSAINTQLLHCFLPFSLSFLPPVHFSKPVFLSSNLTLLFLLAMSLNEAGGVQFQLPVPETGLTDGDIEELLSLLESEDSVGQNSGSDWSNRAVFTVDERKKRRMISNRESARRSRWRKKRHLEDLTAQVNQLRAQNRELKNRLSIVLNQCNVVGIENDGLTSEYVALWTRLSDLYQIVGAMQSQ